jgi:uncharacterized protein (DUF427 family)
MSTMPAATHPPRGRIRIETGAKRVRASLGGEVVADTVRPVLVWEVPYYPTYYFPLADVHADLVDGNGGVTHSPSRGEARRLDVRATKRQAPGAALRYRDSPIEELRDLIRLDWDAMDAWFEEQLAERLLMPAAELRDRRVIWDRHRGDQLVGHVLPARPLDPPRGPVPARV